MTIQKKSKETEEDKDLRLNREATQEKIKTFKHEVKNFKTLEELLREKI